MCTCDKEYLGTCDEGSCDDPYNDWDEDDMVGDDMDNETCLANSTKLCYTYDELSRVTSRIEKTLSGTVLHTERFTYDLAGNITAEADESSFTYDAQNRLVSYQGKGVTYDFDGKKKHIKNIVENN